MPSSISSSNERLPVGGWGKTWLYALIVVAFISIGYETAARMWGFRPAVDDDADLWCYTRGRIHANDRNEIVLVGASRIQLGLNTAVFEEHFGGRKVVNLAVSGTSCIPVLDELSRDQGFCGIVVCDVSP